MAAAAPTNAQSRTIWISAGAPILGLVLIILIAAFWLFADVAKRQDRDFVDNSRALVASSVQGGAQALTNTTMDFAYWNDAYRRISVRWDQTWVEENYYSSVADGIVIFDAAGRVRHAWFSELEGGAAAQAAEAAAQAIAASDLTAMAASADEASSERFVLAGNNLLGLSIAPISFEDASPRRLARASVDFVASIDVLDQAEIASRGAALGLDAMAFAEQAGPPDKAVATPVFGPQGRTIGYFTWRNERPGSEELASRLAPIALGILFIGALAGLVANHLAKRQILALARAEAALESSRLKSEFIATMSHELRTPLNAIIGYGELIGEQVSPGDENEADIRADSSKIVRAAQHLLTLINNILEHSRIDANMASIRLEPVELDYLLAEVDEIANPLAKVRGNALAFHQPQGGAFVLADPVRLRQCLLNLVANAVKFTEHGAIDVTVRQEQVDGAARIAIDVADTGIGIAEEAQQRLFAPFVQADASVARLYGGTGLGLSISRKLARAMGGDISVRSELGKGSVFTLSLPAAAPALRLAA